MREYTVVLLLLTATAVKSFRSVSCGAPP
eukprot:COSAG01_NODE_19974_length_978_cov_2.154721_1_plen_28_part_10